MARKPALGRAGGFSVQTIGAMAALAVATLWLLSSGMSLISRRAGGSTRDVLARLESVAQQIADLQANHKDLLAVQSFLQGNSDLAAQLQPQNAEYFKTASPGKVMPPTVLASAAAPSPAAPGTAAAPGGASAAPAAAAPAEHTHEHSTEVSAAPAAAPVAPVGAAFVPSPSQQAHKEARLSQQLVAPAGTPFSRMGVYELAYLALRDPSDARIVEPLRVCTELKAKHRIVPLKDWGSAARVPQAQEQWHAQRCDLLLSGEVFVQEGHAEAGWFTRFPKELAQWLGERSAEAKQRCARKSTKVVTGVGVTTVSRGIAAPSFSSLPLMVHLVPSLVASADPNFELWLYVLYDSGDVFFDRESTADELRSWLQENFVDPLAAKGVTAQFALLRFANELRKPGPAFNAVMAALHADGADYMARVNDDTEARNGLQRTWQQAMVDSLAAHEPPNFGVVSPEVDGQQVFTHDMVHRTHLEVFPFYYPLTLPDWWMDNWITDTYRELPGRPRVSTRMKDVQWHHHVSKKRYEVNNLNSHLVREEVALGKQAALEWLAAKGK